MSSEEQLCFGPIFDMSGLTQNHREEDVARGYAELNGFREGCMQRTCERSAQPVRQPRYRPTPADVLREKILDQLRLAYRRGSGWCSDAGQLRFWFMKDSL